MVIAVDPNHGIHGIHEEKKKKKNKRQNRKNDSTELGSPLHTIEFFR